MQKWKFVVFLVFIFLCVFLASYFVFNKSIIFHTDIARDFLLIEDIVKNKPLTLIGPRSGGIGGVFHGPAWLYLNVPAFILGQGNPVIVGYFWVFLYVISLVVCFLTSEKLFKNREVSIFSTALLASSTIISVSQLFNPYGAFILTPVFFLLYYKYLLKNKFLDLLLSLLVLGFMVQFQMAFAVPILILTFILSFYLIVKNKKYIYILAFLILLIPLSTFILFDLKHQFLQTNSVLNYLSEKKMSGAFADLSRSSKLHLPLFILLIFNRIKKIFFDNTSLITNNSWILLLGFLFLLFKTLPLIFKEKDKKKKIIYYLFFYFYLGYWFLTLFYKNEIWGYYFWPFFPLIAIIFSSFITYSKNKIFFYIFFFIVLTVNIVYASRSVLKTSESFKKESGSWRFYYGLTQQVYKDANGDFGYYIFSPDLFGYSSRYAMNYTQNEFNKIRAYPFEKKKITYLIMAPSDNPYAQPIPWKRDHIKLVKKPIKIFKYENGFQVEKYLLSDDEIKIQSNQYLIHDLIFR